MLGSRATRAVAVIAALLAVYLVPAGHARAAAPPTVRTDAGVTAEADYLSGRTLTVVCARTAPQWVQVLNGAGLPGAEAAQFYGFSLIPQGRMYLSPYVCQGLRLGSDPATRRSHELQVAWAVDVLVHESTHMGRFTYDEALVEACARAGLPAELHRLYGIAYHSAELRRLTLDAAFFRGTQGPAYKGGTCTAP